jgi:hypothetical protein
MIIHWLILLAAGFAAGIMNSVAGGGSFILFPLLLGNGVPVVMANATTTLIVQPGVLSSAYGYREHLRKLPRRYFILMIPSFIGGIAGAFILQKTSNDVFGKIVPFFVLFAVTLLAAQPLINKHVIKRSAARPKHPLLALAALSLMFLLVATYGGYFGAGFGIMALGLFGLTELTNIHQMNGLKNLVGATFGLSSIIYFVISGLIYWQMLPLLLVGNVAGGYIGATYASKLPSNTIRMVAISIGLAISVLLFRKFY